MAEAESTLSVEDSIAQAADPAFVKRLLLFALTYSRRTYGWTGNPERNEALGRSIPDLVNEALAQYVERCRKKGPPEHAFPFAATVVRHTINAAYWRAARRAETSLEALRGRSQDHGAEGPSWEPRASESNSLERIYFNQLLDAINQAVTLESDPTVRKAWNLLRSGCVEPGSIRDLKKEMGGLTSEAKNAWRKIRRIAADARRRLESNEKT